MDGGSCSSLVAEVASGVHMPEVSVIVPVYNTEHTLGRCLDSILAQTVDDLEVVVVDDGSPDDARDVAHAYAARDARVRVVSQSNAGLGAARNTGINEAKGEHLAFVDSDDFIEPDLIERMLDAIKETGCALAVCEAFVDEFDEGGEVHVVSKMSLPEAGEVISGFEAFSYLANQITPTFNSMCFKVVRRDMFTDLGIAFPEDHRFVEDMPVSSALLLESPQVALVHAPLYHYVKNDSILSMTYSLRKARDVCMDLDEICETAQAAGYPGSLDNLRLGMLFSAIKQIVWSGELAASRLELDALIARGKAIAPAFQEASIPLSQKMKMMSVHMGMAVPACRLIWRLKWLPYLKYLA